MKTRFWREAAATSSTRAFFAKRFSFAARKMRSNIKANSSVTQRIRRSGWAWACSGGGQGTVARRRSRATSGRPDSRRHLPVLQNAPEGDHSITPSAEPGRIGTPHRRLRATASTRSPVAPEPRPDVRAAQTPGVVLRHSVTDQTCHQQIDENGIRSRRAFEMPTTSCSAWVSPGHSST